MKKEKIKMTADYHVHTCYSSDSDYPMEEVVKDAIKKNISELCFTDHVDYGTKEDQDTVKEIRYIEGIPLINVDYPKYMQEISKLKEIYKDKITIKTGMEFGIQTHTIKQFEDLFIKYDFDFIILSIHQIEDKELWNQDFQRNRPQKEVYEKYYQELLEVIRNYKNYSVLGHLDLISRYEMKNPYPFEKVKGIIKEILNTVIRDGKGIELNTSYHRYGLSDSTPS